MSTKQQRGNRSIRPREGFWPFNPEGPPGKETASLGDKSGYSSIKNYPSLTHGLVENEESEKLSPAGKRLRRKKAS
jgi:hypothetical protein